MDELAALRRAIDALDDQLYALLVQRLDRARALGALKPVGGRDPGREAAIVARLSAHGPLDPELVALIWAAFFAASDKVQQADRLDAMLHAERAQATSAEGPGAPSTPRRRED